MTCADLAAKLLETPTLRVCVTTYEHLDGDPYEETVSSVTMEPVTLVDPIYHGSVIEIAIVIR